MTHLYTAEREENIKIKRSDGDFHNTLETATKAFKLHERERLREEADQQTSRPREG